MEEREKNTFNFETFCPIEPVMYYGFPVLCCVETLLTTFAVKRVSFCICDESFSFQLHLIRHWDWQAPMCILDLLIVFINDVTQVGQSTVDCVIIGVQDLKLDHVIWNLQ